AVVEAALGQVDEAGDGDRGLLGEQADADRAAGGGEDGGEGHGRGSGRMGAGQARLALSMIHCPTHFPSRKRPRRPFACPSKSSATSPSSPTSTTARPPWSTSCSSSPARSASAPSSPSA